MSASSHSSEETWQRQSTEDDDMNSTDKALTYAPFRAAAGMQHVTILMLY